MSAYQARPRARGQRSARVVLREPAWPSNARPIIELIGEREVECIVIEEQDGGSYHLLVTDRGEVFSWWASGYELHPCPCPDAIDVIRSHR